MQREIRFRAWDKRDNKMHFESDDDYLLFRVRNGKTFAVRVGGFLNGDRPLFCETDQLIVMQYTGLHDKNGNEIYEGDIVSKFRKDVKHNKIESRYPVCFGIYDNGEAYEDLVQGNGWHLGQQLFFHAGVREGGRWESKCDDLIDANDLEVIGNIYEHPDSLEVK